MLIKYGCYVKELYLGSRKSPITYTYGGVHSVKVSIKKVSKKNSPIKDSGDVSACHALGSFKTSEKIRQFFISISNNELPDEMSEKVKVLDYLKNTAKTVDRIDIKFFPQSFQDFRRNISSELNDIVKRTVGIYMWRRGITDGHNLLFNPGMSFSLDGNKWFGVPGGIRVHFRGISFPTPSRRISLSLKQLINNALDKPLGHQLFTEAQSLRDANSRISIVVAMSALEVAVKECISKLNPDSSWLVENVPSPNVRKLINEYIPKLLSETDIENIFPLPQTLDKTIQIGVSIRNQVVHLGRQAPSRETIDKVLSAVQDVIWLLDFCSGHDWAIGYVSENTKNNIKVKTENKGYPVK